MKKMVFAMITILLVSCAELKKLGIPTDGSAITIDEIVKALKEALGNGTTKGSNLLSQIDGYYKSPYKIFIPSEAQNVIDKLKFIPGFSNLEEQLTIKLNRAAEQAATKAAPIFLNAITNMTFADAKSILMGPDTAATTYLKNQTYQALYNEFQPIILQSLNEVKAADLWDKAITAYNKIPLIAKVNPRLDDYVTNQALKGLFGMVAKEETGIRHDISLRTSDLLKKVFGQQDKGN